MRTIKINTFRKKLCKNNAPLSFRFFEFASHYMKYTTSVKQFHFRISSFCYVALYYFILLEKNKLSTNLSLINHQIQYYVKSISQMFVCSILSTNFVNEAIFSYHIAVLG